MRKNLGATIGRNGFEKRKVLNKCIESFMSRVATLMNKLSPIGTLLQKTLKVLCLSMILKYEVGFLIFKCLMK